MTRMNQMNQMAQDAGRLVGGFSSRDDLIVVVVEHDIIIGIVIIIIRTWLGVATAVMKSRR